MAVSSSYATDEIVVAGELMLRPSDQKVSARGRVLALSRREFDLLLVLVRRPGRIVAREDLHDAVWGTPYAATDRSVDVYVHKLRVKLGAALPEWRHIHTHFGLGYRFEPERSQDFHKTATDR